MSLFNLFGKKEEASSAKDEKHIPWVSLSRIEQLEEISEISKTCPVAIFKHSTTCGISRMVLRNFETDFDISNTHMKLYYLDLKSFREVSNEVAIKFEVLHQSPQLLVIKNGIAVFHESHYSIQASVLNRFI